MIITSRSRRTIWWSHQVQIFRRSGPRHIEPYGVGVMRKLLWGHRASKTAVLSAPLAGHHFGDSEHSSTALRPFFLPLRRPNSYPPTRCPSPSTLARQPRGFCALDRNIFSRCKRMPAPERHVADATGKDTNCLRVAWQPTVVSSPGDSIGYQRRVEESHGDCALNSTWGNDAITRVRDAGALGYGCIPKIWRILASQYPGKVRQGFSGKFRLSSLASIVIDPCSRAKQIGASQWNLSFWSSSKTRPGPPRLNTALSQPVSQSRLSPPWTASAASSAPPSARSVLPSSS